MESITFSGDAFSEYYLRDLFWDEPRLKPLAGNETVDASYRRAAFEILRAQRALRSRQQARSTRTLLLNPLADILQWQLGEAGIVETEEGPENGGQPLTIEGRTVARVLAIEPDSPIDLPATGIHRRFAPSLSIVRVLEESGLTWAVLMNAYELRIVRRAEGFVSSHIGFDLTSIAEGRQSGFDAWRLLWALLRVEALSIDPPVVDRVVTNGREHQAGVSEKLGQQVRGAIVAFMQGVLSNPSNQTRIPEPVTKEYLQALYADTLRVLYRVLFALYAESRQLLPLDLPAYRDGYSVTRLAKLVASPETDPRRCPTSSGRFYELSLRSLFELLRQGANLGPEGKIPRYNGAMFDHGRTELIEGLEWGDGTVAEVLEKLTRIPSRTGQVRLSYRELDVEQLGAVYESLLEQIPQMAGETMYRIALDARELIVNSEERRRLAERRGETQADDVSSTSDEEEHGVDDEDSLQDEGEDNDAEGEDDDERPARRSSKPLRVIGEITQGTVYLKSGMGRKQTGSFYTARPLVEFLVRRSIDPLASGKLPEEILRLRILDPAMGSGHFLVGACRRLSEHLLASYRRSYERVAADHPIMSPGDIFAEAGIHPEVVANWEWEDRALTACRLLVAGNCVYGVDKNPLAVELARVSLWLATAATDHPLTFLDHRLRCGDSLLGLPVYLGGENEPEVHLLRPDQLARQGRSRRSRTSGTPLLDGVGTLDVVTEGARRLRERVGRAMQHLQTISELTDERPEDFAGHRVAFDAMQEELRSFVELHALRIGREFLQSETPAELAIANQWLSEIAADGRVSDASIRLARKFVEKGREVGAFCWYLAFPEVFFTADGQIKENPGFDVVIGNPPWDKIKPNERECFADFDPTVWDVQGQERKRLINSLMRENPLAKDAWEKHESETKTVSKLLLEGGLFHHQMAVVEEKKTGGDPDTFKFFTERAWQLLRSGGRAGVIVPLGIQGSLGTTGLRRLLLDECQLQALIKLDNERYIFPGVFHGQKFDLLVFAKGGPSDTFDAAFLSWEPADAVLRLENDPRRLTIEAGLYRELAPEQYTFVELHSQNEVNLLRQLYRQHPRLDARIEDAWNVTFTREFDMTNHSFLFRDAARLREFDSTLHSFFPSVNESADGAPHQLTEGGEYWTSQSDVYYSDLQQRFVQTERWIDRKGKPHMPGAIGQNELAYCLTGYILRGEERDVAALPIKPGETYVPLYEGRMVHQFDHCCKGYVSGSGRRARWKEIPWHEKRIAPHYFAALADFETLKPGCSQIRAASCDVTGQTNERSCLGAIVPAGYGCGHSINAVWPTSERIDDCLMFVAFVNSFVFDFIARLQISNHASPYILRSIPVPRRIGDVEQKDLMSQCGLLTSTTAELTRVWERLEEVQQTGAPQAWTRQVACLDIRQRASLRAQIDAIVASVYGIQAEDYVRILSSFPLLDQDQPRLPGDCFIRQTNKGEKVVPRGFITRDQALLSYFELTNQAPPTDIVSFYARAGVDIERNTGPIRDLRVRVEEAGRRGAVAYIPTQHKGWRPRETEFLPPDLPADLVENWNGNLANYIVNNPQVNGGEPTLAGTRITVQLIYDLLSQGWTFPQIIESYPHLNEQQIAIALRLGDLQ